MTVRVVGLCGSLRDGSLTRRAVAEALDGAAAAGADTGLIDMRGMDIPIMAGDKDAVTPDVEALQASVRAADGVILGTPEYHGGYSGVLKNALDWMGFDEFEGKIVGLVSVSGGMLGGAYAMESLRTVCRAVHAWVVPTQCGVPRAAKAFEDLDPSMQKRLRTVGEEVARFAALHTSRASQRFLEEWESAIENPGA